MPTAYRHALFWFRRDLRHEDNAGLHDALTSAERVHCVFAFDSDILEALPDRHDRRVDFIRASLLELDAALTKLGGGLIVLHGAARTAIPRLAEDLGVDAVFTNGDYEPDARDRDDAVERALVTQGRRLHRAKDTVIFEKDEVLTQAGRPFTVFTPYKNAWNRKLEAFYVRPYPIERHAARLAPPPTRTAMPSLEALGFAPTGIVATGLGAGMSGARKLLEAFEARMDRYDEARNFPALPGSSLLSVHNRFGTVSIRELVRRAQAHSNAGGRTWLSELTWRDFYFQFLWHHPRVARESYQAQYARMDWPGSDAHFGAWQQARTGYPLVDAAMRQLETTGFMHNRLRMVTASFLCKDLLVDWRRGEAHFAAKLNDYDLSANNGGWQWAASTGCDPQPWFRIFNPVTQSEKFDPEGRFIRTLLPQLARVPDKYIHMPWTMPADVQATAGCRIGRDYPAPIVDHAGQREKALALYGRARSVS